MSSVRDVTWSRIALFSIFFLFFFELLADFIEAVYAFGLRNTSIQPEIISMLLLFSPLLLLLFRNRLPRILLIASIAMVLLSRVLEPMLDTWGRMLVSGVGVACFLLLFAALVRQSGWGIDRKLERSLGAGLALAVAMSVLFRTLDSGRDLSTSGGTQIIGWAQIIGWGLVLLAGVLVLPFLRRARDRHSSDSPGAGQTAGHGQTISLSLGITAVFILLYFVFTAPQVLARWTGADYRFILPLFMLALTGFAWLMSRRRPRLSHSALLSLNLLFILSLALTAGFHQLYFPTDPAAYPLPASVPSPLHLLPLILTLLIFPILLLDFMLLASELVALKPSPRALGLGFGLSSLFLLLAIFGQIFTTVYAYIPVVGPYFRNEFWAVHLVVGVVLFLSLLLIKERSADLPTWPVAMPTSVLLIGLGAVAGGFLVSSHPSLPAQTPQQLTILTYNIQQGYSIHAQKNFDNQLALIRRLAPDLIGLEESDDARIAGGNSDIVRYFSNGLNMYSYYGPKTITGTFGIALLSRYPIHHPRTYFLYSKDEQVAVIQAQIKVGNHTFNVFVTHLGNSGALVQQQEFLQLVRGKPDVIAMGDFNFVPDTEQYRLTTTILDDSWTLRWPKWVNNHGQSPDREIDHIFVSPGTRVLVARYIEKPLASDHPALIATVRW